MMTVPTTDAPLLLVAEDNAINRKVIAHQLDVLGYTCELRNDGAQALEAWRTGRFDLLLTDCNMPVMDGYELTAQVRQAERESGHSEHVPIVALTANALQGESERCLHAGMDDFLSKPVNLDRLRSVLERWLHNRGENAGAAVLDGHALAMALGGSKELSLVVHVQLLSVIRALGQRITAAHAAGAHSALVEDAGRLATAASAGCAPRLANASAALTDGVPEANALSEFETSLNLTVQALLND